MEALKSFLSARQGGVAGVTRQRLRLYRGVSFSPDPLQQWPLLAAPLAYVPFDHDAACLLAAERD